MKTLCVHVNSLRSRSLLPTIFRHLLGVTGREAVGGCCFCLRVFRPLEGGNRSWGTFHGELTWSPATWYGSERWRIVMQFSEDLMLPRWAFCRRFWSFFCWVNFLGGRFFWGGNHLDRWSKRFDYTYIYIYVYGWLSFFGKWWFGWGLEKGQKLTSTEVLVVDELGFVHLKNSGRGFLKMVLMTSRIHRQKSCKVRYQYICSVVTYICGSSEPFVKLDLHN